MRGFIDGEYQDGDIRGLLLLLGRRGSGKTCRMVRLLGGCTGGRIFFDTLSRHAHLMPDYVLFNEPDSLVPYLRTNRGRQFKVLYQPRRGNLDDHFSAVCGIVEVFEWMIFAVDEVDKVCGMRFGESRMPKPLYNLVNYGRHVKVSMVVSARRPQSVPTGLRDEAELFVFRLKPGKALEALEDRIGRETAAQVANLAPFTYLRILEDEDPVLCGGADFAL